MAHATINYTPLEANKRYTIAQINTLFSNLADFINNKVDRAHTPSVAANIELQDDIAFNLQPVINLAPGVDAQDAVTVKQVRELIG